MISFFLTDCSFLANLPHGSVSYSSGTTYLSVAKFQCQSGYTLSADVNRTCQADKTWSGASPACEINGKVSLLKCEIINECCNL